MTTPSYSNIQPLVQNIDVRGRTLQVRFVCSVSGHAVDARYTVPRDNSMGSRVSQQMKRNLMWSLQSAVASAIRSTMGHNMAGRVASDMARSAMTGVQQQVNSNTLSSREQNTAVVEAFRTVQGQFVWDAQRNTWISQSAMGEAMSDFERMLAAAPIAHPYDRQVMARMLVEIARGDGRLSSEESTWLTEVITADLGDVQTLAARPPLTAAELGSASAGAVRKSLLVLAWAMALVDEEMADAERTLLGHYSRGLGLPHRDVEACRKASQTYILDQAMDRMFTWGGHDEYARAQLYGLAERIGMPVQEAQEAEARHLRRKSR
ncbi:MAG: hypothetical protein CL927_14105 [Deltaproteobacteria bacterium]|nr:hypothetical protein [Deltaproteobacteria bacterium]HCH64108.1 hypothetical protein [Deltaproteobacteria bacterium]